MRLTSAITLCLGSLWLSACGGGGGDGGGTQSYTVGGSVSGLAGHGLVLGNNGANPLAVSANGSFTFASAVPNGVIYDVQVVTQPTGPSQACSVTQGSGVISGSNITNVAVTCKTNVYTVGGTVSGLSGSGLTLANNGSSQLSVPGNGSFTFGTGLSDGTSYNVTIAAQPSGPTQTCTVAKGTGTLSGGNVTTVQVTCATNSYSVGVTVSGLVGTGLALSLNGGVPVPIPGNGAFQFPGVLPSGSNFNVEVTTQPLGPTQSCLTTNGSGTVGGGDVSVIANCATISAFAYVFGRPLPGLVGYTVDLLTGRLTQLPGPAFSNPGAAVPSNVLPSRDGKHLYLTEGGTIYVYSITPPPSPQMGSLSLVGTTTIDPISGLAIDAGGKFLYATSNAQGSAGYVAAFNIDATTGALSRIATYLSGSGPSGVAVYPTASFLLVTNYTSNNVSVFSIDTGAGTLAPVSGSPFPAGRGPESVAITPNGKFAYVGNYGASNGEPPYVSSYTVDSSTGILTSISNAIGIENPTAVAVDPTGQYLFVSGDMMYIQECDAINAISGVPTFPCPFRFPPLVPNGGVFAEAPAAYAFDPTGQFMYVTSAIGTSVAQFTSSPVNLTVVQSITGFYNGSPSGGGIAIAPVK